MKQNYMGIFFDQPYSIRIVFARGHLPGGLVTSFNDWNNYHTPIN